MTVEIEFEKVTNSHDGYCSDSDCRPVKEDADEMKQVELPLSDLDDFEIPSEGEDVDRESLLFDYFARLYNHWNYEEKFQMASGYCGNQSETLEKHTENYTVSRVTIVKIALK